MSLYVIHPLSLVLSNMELPLVWSNFEIGDLDFWRGEAYTKYFEHLDKKGGFYYEVRFCSCEIALEPDLGFSQ